MTSAGGQTSQPRPPAWRRDVVVTLLALVALLLWDVSSMDLLLMQGFGNPAGFAWRDHWLPRIVLHDGGRLVGWCLLGSLILNTWKPVWPVLPLAERWRWLGMTLACLLLVPLVKKASSTSCPWDLAMFGGVAQHLSHWRWGVSDGGPGGCFPSGHAVAAFAFLSGWFALRERHPAPARRWLLAVLAAGVLFGGAQMVRGAHFASHTLWTAWLCWVICAAMSAWPRARDSGTTQPI